MVERSQENSEVHYELVEKKIANRQVLGKTICVHGVLKHKLFLSDCRPYKALLLPHGRQGKATTAQAV